MFNLSLLFVDTAFIGILLRFLTGVTLAGVYPTAVKILSLWFPAKRGLAIGILIASLTLGSSLPHLSVLFFSNVKWQLVIGTSSILAIISSIIVFWILQDAPNQGSKTVFSLSLIKKVIKNKPVMLANFGYFGHQWELYAMWTWLPSFLAASFASVDPNRSPSYSALAAFITIGIAGALGCILGGYVADKMGRAQLTMIAMTISGLCALLIGFTFGKPIWLTFLVAFIWGIFVIADSAQFSASVSEFAEVEYVGTALTFQMCVGFLITIITINLVPIIQKIIGWEWVFSLLSIGPIFGIISMGLFKKYESKKNRAFNS